jgi:hypothetical protein
MAYLGAISQAPHTRFGVERGTDNSIAITAPIHSALQKAVTDTWGGATPFEALV